MTDFIHRRDNMRLFILRLALALGLCASPPFLTARAEGNDLPVHACVQADSVNPVYYETSSAEWSGSPDGASLVYDRAVGDVSQLRVLRLASGDTQCITNGRFHDTQPNWSRTGGRIAFVRRIDGISQIHLLTVDDGSVEGLTDPTVRSEYPTFSRQGTMLAYVRFDPDNPRRRFVVVRELASANEQVVFDSPFGLNNLSWSADDTAVLLYSIDEDGWNDVYAANVDGTEVRRLTDNTVTDTYSAEYSPDGRRLLFGQGSGNSPYQRWFNYDLYEKELATGEVRRLTWAFNADDRGHYAPDGRTIGFTSRRSGYAEIMLMDADGGHLRTVTQQPDGELATYIRDQGVSAGQAYFDATRRRVSKAKLIGEVATLVLTRQFIARRQPQEAVAVARLGVATHADSWRTRTALGESLLAAGDRDNASEAFRQSLAIFPNQYQLVFLLGFEDFFGQLESIDGIWREKGGDLLDLVQRLQTRGDVLSALALLHRLDDARPNDADVLSALAHTHMMLGDSSEAVETYQRVIRLDPTLDEARFHFNRIQRLGPVR